MSVYSIMNSDWKVYCLMSAIIYIEEMSKPTPHIQIKKYKNNSYKCICFHTVRLKMKDKDFVELYFNITKSWEKKLGVKLIGRSYKEPRKENYDGQYSFLLSPLWLNLIIKECGRVPNLYSFETAIERINHLKHYKKIDIDPSKDLFSVLSLKKEVASCAFILSMDLEFHGIQSGRPALCMSEKFKDFFRVYDGDC